MPLNLLVWLFGLLITAIPIIIVFAAHLIPGAGTNTDIALLDVARQAYPNILFVVIAVSGIAIAEAIIVFFRMIETGQQRATAALWLLCAVLLIIFGSIAFGEVAGSQFNPGDVSGQQISLAVLAAIIALMAAMSLRVSMLKLETVARQQIRDEAAAGPIDMGIDRADTFRPLDEDPYDLGGLKQDPDLLEEPVDPASRQQGGTDNSNTKQGSTRKRSTRKT